MKLLTEVLLDEPELRKHLKVWVIEQRHAADHDAPGAADLERERNELRAAIQSTVRALEGAALADAQDELERLGAQRNAVESKLARIRNVQPQDQRSVDQVVDDAVKVLAEDSRQLLTLASAPLRDAANRLIPSLSVDMATKAVDLHIRLPVWATAAKATPRKPSKKAEKEACLTTTSWSSNGGETHIIFATAGCEYGWKRGSRTEPPCYTCRRLAA